LEFKIFSKKVCEVKILKGNFLSFENFSKKFPGIAFGHVPDTVF